MGFFDSDDKDKKKKSKYRFFEDTGAKELQQKSEYDKAKKEREEYLKKKKKSKYKDGGVVKGKKPCHFPSIAIMVTKKKKK